MLKNKVKKLTGGVGGNSSSALSISSMNNNPTLALTGGRLGDYDAETFITGTKIA